MHCPKGSTKESLPLYLLVPGSLSHGNMEEFQGLWQGRDRPGKFFGSDCY